MAGADLGDGFSAVALFVSACGAKPAPNNAVLAAEAVPATASVDNPATTGKPVAPATTGNRPQQPNSSLD
jgi:hypothetical protein